MVLSYPKHLIKPSNTDRFVDAFSNAAVGGVHQHRQSEALKGQREQENAAFKQRFGQDLVSTDEKGRLAELNYYLKKEGEAQKLQQRQEMLKAYGFSPQEQEQSGMDQSSSTGKQLRSGGNPNQNPSNTSPEDYLDQATKAEILGETGISRIQQKRAEVQQKEKHEETRKLERKEDKSEKREDKLETRNAEERIGLKKELVERANSARQGIANKKKLQEIIRSGNLDDPTFAAIASSLPLNLGHRLLSPETVAYKSALIDEFADLKNTFPGAIRVKEIEIYEKKMADLYLTDAQKMGVLDSRIDALQKDVVMEDAASEVEAKHPNLSLLQFNKKVNEVAKDKMNAVFEQVWDQQKFIIDQAEKRKKVALDFDNPEDAEIISQLMQEANGNESAFINLVKKKGYRF